MHTVYVLKSIKDGRTYVGCTKDLHNRIKEHNSGEVKSTKLRSPFVLWYKEEVVAIEKGNEVDGIPSYKGRGIGKQLIKQTFAEVKKLGSKAVVADTNERHDRGGSPEFLEACGFKLIGEVERYFDGDPNEVGLIYIYHP